MQIICPKTWLLVLIELSHLGPLRKEKSLGPSLLKGHQWFENPLLSLHIIVQKQGCITVSWPYRKGFWVYRYRNIGYIDLKSIRNDRDICLTTVTKIVFWHYAPHVLTFVFTFRYISCTILMYFSNLKNNCNKKLLFKKLPQSLVT